MAVVLCLPAHSVVLARPRACRDRAIAGRLRMAARAAHTLRRRVEAEPAQVVAVSAQVLKLF